MTRSEKEQLVKELSDAFNEANCVVICDFKGMSVKEMEGFRKIGFEAGLGARVVKNTLAEIAFKNAGIEGVELRETNMAIWGEDPIATAKAVAKYAKENDKFVIKGGVIEKEPVDAAKIIEYSKLAGREELLGMLLSVWTAPLRNMVCGLDNLAKKKEEEAA
ncbi:50S ribosomal protein L10 [Hydrogenimonas thermophila]|uniref:Large ribosomal subunit protein uL10 n=1 Tax=Hydrogenimonas thermophila TaxID=223786 RepID=A0A1I5LAA6_9BACT|nr:50S ribosomal protein L10 [Hydrogenimonas thermophila]WOE70155.1 50S ribosomal protein L10 [Hydrogenimonas thermophila]WOE72672.1 50S ribosomal protein L10 [Hydrogenimonas thermophila]SFO94187.1 LSU ribosomal protein L10P [Hydrogenimonas thermophila]